ncbi:hypothetical protein Ga0074812_12341 [Parafrankia irregularis]|uniref:Probable inorganic carbon transporter subunit DabA n=1 Tax=Parafrankia irregularis TaxID=795642 RepID=A0A0S4QTI6_9ACTN|nr:MULTISPECIES: DUF2309 domain-containing protein [Parafrankia]MBE3202399.1 DUF2309 domain-containing protein [Parafrankia sp. CH37]CUU58913.1 hypothetical protein Ga0074812_12341 [Parafrankia irregularis]
MAHVEDQTELIVHIVEEVAELLPPQAPLGYFSHHNPLHALEELPFPQAVERAGALLGTAAFQTERAFSDHLSSGRILTRDLVAVLDQHGGPGGDASASAGDAEILPGGPTWNDFRLARLGLFVDVPSAPAVSWRLADGGELSHFHPLVSPARREELTRQARRRFPASRRRSPRGRAAERKALRAALLSALWGDLLRCVPPAPPRAVPLRRRDQLLHHFGVDIDEMIHPVLIRLCAAFLDQGMAAWELPHREDGLLTAFRHLFGTLGATREPHWSGLAAHLRRQLRQGWTAERTVTWALRALRVPVPVWPEAVRATLMSLRGWAGMVRQFEAHPDRAPSQPSPARLVDLLAVQLTLEVVVVRHLLGQTIGPDATPEDLGPLGDGAPAGPTGEARPDRPAQDLAAPGMAVPGRSAPDLELVYEAFVLAQIMDVETEALGDPRWARAWLGAVADLGSRRRRWLLHLAYERRYRTEILDALTAHDRRFPELGLGAGAEAEAETEAGAGAGAGDGGASEAAFQAVFCMDEREESLRRHLEEIHPRVRTYGAAGFFGVAMAYQGLDDVRPRALCPVSVTPHNLVVEQAVDQAELIAYQQTRRRDAHRHHILSAARGRSGRPTGHNAVAGLARLVPLVVGAVAPRAVGERARMLCPHDRPGPWPRTRLAVEASEGVEAGGVESGSSAGAGAVVGGAGLVPGVGAGPLRLGFTVDEMTEIVDTLLTTIGMTGPTGGVVLVIGHGSSSVNNPHAAAYDCSATGGGRSGPNARAFAAMANHPRVRAALARRGRLIGPDTWFVAGHHDTCEGSLTCYDTDLVPAGSQAALATATEALRAAVQLDAHERCRRFESVGADVAADTAHAHVRGRSADIAQSRPEYGHSTNATCVIGRRSRTRGLYLDRRSFLVSYDPTADHDGSVLTRLLLSTAPVGAGISLEYYFSAVDPTGFGAGSKLPHNISGLVGVMDGHASDLRTGMPWQSVEIHEPMRLLMIVEAEPDLLASIVRGHPHLRRLVDGGWIQLAAWDPHSPRTWLHVDGRFEPHQPESLRLPMVARSEHYYAGQRDHLPPAHVLAACEPARVDIPAQAPSPQLSSERQSSEQWADIPEQPRLPSRWLDAPFPDRPDGP